MPRTERPRPKRDRAAREAAPAARRPRCSPASARRARPACRSHGCLEHAVPRAARGLQPRRPRYARAQRRRRPRGRARAAAGALRRAPTLDLLETMAALQTDDPAPRRAPPRPSARASDPRAPRGALLDRSAPAAGLDAERDARPSARPCGARRGRCTAIAARPAASRPSTTSGNARAASAGTPIRRNGWRTCDATLPSRADALARARVLVVGDAMLDRYWFGAVDRISPEAPVPVVRVNREEERLGGAANVAYNVQTLGAQATLAHRGRRRRAGRQAARRCSSSAASRRCSAATRSSTRSSSCASSAGPSS